MSFLEKVLAGKALAEDIDSYVEDWHESSTRQTLPAFLGMTDDEYALWVEQPEALSQIIYSRRFNRKPRNSQELWGEIHLLAARSQSQHDASVLKKWLESKGV